MVTSLGSSTSSVQSSGGGKMGTNVYALKKGMDLDKQRAMELLKVLEDASVYKGITINVKV